MDTADVVEVLGALAQETRLDVLRLLVQAGPGGLAAGEIARRLDVPPPTLSFHLRAMSHAGLVASERDGRSLVYAADYDALERVLAFLAENCCAGAAGSRPGRRAGRRRVAG